jgi:uncharacterized membrane protein
MTAYYIMVGILLVVLGVVGIWVDKVWKKELEKELKEANK